MSIGTKSLKQIAMVTGDFDETVKKWSAILGVEPQFGGLPEFKDMPAYTDGTPDLEWNQDLKIAMFNLDDGFLLEIFDPGETDSAWKRHLDRHGESVMYIGFMVPDRQKAYSAIGAVCDAKKPYHTGFFSELTYSFVDTSPDLGVELNIKAEDDNKALLEQMLVDPDSYQG